MNDTKFIILFCIVIAILLMSVMLIGDYLAKTLRHNWLMIGFGIGAVLVIVFGMAAKRACDRSIQEIRKNKGLD